jgi:hypothetical protein
VKGLQPQCELRKVNRYGFFRLILLQKKRCSSGGLEVDKRAVAVSLLSRCAAQISQFRALRQLYRSFVSENSPEAKGRTLLRQWLTPAQRRQFEEQGYFDVVGRATRRRYRVQYGSVANVQEIDFEGCYGPFLCFAPGGYLVPGDAMLAQKIALETDELATLAVANRLAPVVRRVGPAQSRA